jgi:hypothetical protein
MLLLERISLEQSSEIHIRFASQIAEYRARKGKALENHAFAIGKRKIKHIGTQTL